MTISIVTAGAKDRVRHTIGLSGGLTWATFLVLNPERMHAGRSQPVGLNPSGVAYQISCMPDVHITILSNSSKITIVCKVPNQFYGRGIATT